MNYIDQCTEKCYLIFKNSYNLPLISASTSIYILHTSYDIALDLPCMFLNTIFFYNQKLFVQINRVNQCICCVAAFQISCPYLGDEPYRTRTAPGLQRLGSRSTSVLGTQTFLRISVRPAGAFTCLRLKGASFLALPSLQDGSGAVRTLLSCRRPLEKPGQPLISTSFFLYIRIFTINSR